MSDVNTEPDPLLDETKAQNAADAQVLINEIGPARMELARLKVAYYAMVAGITLTFEVRDKSVQGNREARLYAVRKLIEQAQERIRALQVMYEDISRGATVPVPESPLKVVTGGAAGK